MSDMNELGESHIRFRDKYEMFLAETQLSFAAAAQVLDVSPGTLKDWYRVRDGRLRKPATHIMRSAELKIDRLNEAHREFGVYGELYGLRPDDRVAYLLSKLHSHRVTA